MAKNVIGIAGHKEAGKDSATRFIYGQMMMKSGLIDSFQIGEKGELFVPIQKEKPEDENQYGMFLIDPFLNYELEIFLSMEVWPSVKKMAFADPLKTFCADYLNIDPKLLWGTNEDKETLTEYTLHKLPIFTITDVMIADYLSYCTEDKQLTVRELLQYVGTEMFRKIDPDYWVKLNLRLINNTETELAVVSDVRFPNEVGGLKDSGAYLIYLTRNIHEGDEHSSETSVDKMNKSLFDLVIDNQNMTIDETHAQIEKFLNEKGIL